MSKQSLYLFVGFPGSGKTTISKLIEQLSGAKHLWADHERTAMFNRPTHSQKESTELYKYLNEKTARLLQKGESVIFDTNFNFRADRDYLRSIADNYGAQTVIIWVKTPKELAKQRATHETHRQKNGYHYTMSSADFERLTDHLQPPSDDEHYIAINGSDVKQSDVTSLLGL